MQDKYRGSEEEDGDLLRTYTESRGNMSRVFDRVLLSDPALDSHRFMDAIQGAIERGECWFSMRRPRLELLQGCHSVPGILITDLGCPSYVTATYQVSFNSSQPSTPLSVTSIGVGKRNALL